MRHLLRITLASLVLLAPACSRITAHAEFTPTRNYTPRPRSPNDIDVLLVGDVSKRPIVRVAQLNAARSDYQGNGTLMRVIREEAARVGLDGVADLDCGPAYSYAYQCAGTGFVYQP